MAVSLETRAPFVDHRLVEFIARIPFRYKLNGLTSKYILKEAMRGILPDEIIDRHKKGFSMPLNRWIKEGELKQAIEDTLFSKRFRDLGAFSLDFAFKFKQISLEFGERHVRGNRNRWQTISSH